MEHNSSMDADFCGETPEETLLMENEFLKVKILAETGHDFESYSELSPEYEHTVLQSILQPENESVFARKKLRDYVKPPHFEPAENLSERDFRNAYKRLKNLLKKHRINVHFIRKKNARFRYNFVVEELFNSPHTYFFIKGMHTEFIYENFHPDLEIELHIVTEIFFTDFFNMNIQEDYPLIADLVACPDWNQYQKHEFINQFTEFFESIESFNNGIFEIAQIELETLEDQINIIAECRGWVYYEVDEPDGDFYIVSGIFSLHFLKVQHTWLIISARVPGFNIDQK